MYYRNRHVWLHESLDGAVHQLPFPNRNTRKTKFHGWTVAKKNSAIPRLKMWTAVRPGGRTELSSPLKPQVSEPWKSAVLTCDWAGIWPLLSAKRTGELQLARKQNKILENTIYLHKQNHSMHNEMQSTGMLMVNSAAHFRICLLVKLMSCVSLDMFDNSAAQNWA